jgi:hypothetical protein
MNVPNCGLAEPCIGAVVNNEVGQCSALRQSQCSVYKTCLDCVGNQQTALNCYWCDDGMGNRVCDSSCNNGETKVQSCSIFGPTTTGLTITNNGQTGNPSTGETGTSPSGYTPGGSGTPGTTPAPAPTAVPTAVPTTVPGFVPGTAPATVPSNVPGSDPTGAPTTVPAYVPGTTPANVPGLVPGTTPPPQAPSSGFISGFDFVLFAIVVVISLILV